mmetsp:Transcript_19845/g.41786  ORF Transcript_19845/g.41786 Transcript_19845/m.41786 type:complete len:438 (-) Transcript_19845:67-1380(-)|eukprot:CAMPEP_0183728064 /NCGR_PEP_ID=MMETSP0737-20130205/27114_1 /TAXON_ID=385413 /ORGANISM="Thalassiosira miniscula, Strain CCMP1093" /LENGTH=437 /DNA_ID=CAMNT_0025959895 /DNA_START=137 /DNA_END=1450 /DNA_ORIENTATION=+
MISCAISAKNVSRWSAGGTVLLKRAWRRCGRSASSVALSSRSENYPGDIADNLCHLRERLRANPSEEHAAFAFARLASPGHSSIGPSEFISVLKRMQLDFNLGDHALRRVFDSLDTDGDGRLSLEEFKTGGGKHPFTRALVDTLSSSWRETNSLNNANDHQDLDFDPSMSTAEFYSAPLEKGFVGENVKIREKLDYCYHSNYTEKRQHFQDALIKSNVLLNGSGSDKPWYVLTCGPMGAGKGWVLGWMSATGILQLERVSKIDPDAFKFKMPEWQTYQKHGLVGVAGTRTHVESSYIAEIAQHIAMNNSMDVWIDGSLRNWQWYEIELKRIRKQYPQYRIAIISISAPQEMITSNIKRRAKETGREIPDEMRQAANSDAIRHGVIKLTHLVDLVASVRNTPANEESGKIAEPVLRFVSMVDRSGNWDLIRELASTDT